MPTQPTIGRIVHYKLSASDAEAITRRRVAKPHAEGWPEGAQAHVGNPVSEGTTVPAIVVSLLTNDPTVINGQCLLDGNDSCWITSSHQGEENGQWQWPPRQ